MIEIVTIAASNGVAALALTPVLPEPTSVGALSAQIEASKAAVCYVRNTSSIPAVGAGPQKSSSHRYRGNSLKNLQEISARSDTHGSISI
jgi:hypothetical protein